MKVTKQQLQKAWDNFLVEEVKEHGGIPYLTRIEGDFREALAGFLGEDNEDDEALLNMRALLVGMQLSMRIVRNSGETFFNGKKPDELLLEGICSMIRIVQVEIGSGRMEQPVLTPDEVEEIRRIS